MKKFLSVLLIITMSFSAFLLSSCGKNDEITLEEKVDSKLTAYRTDIEDSLATLNTPEEVTDYLSHWAQTKGIDHVTENNNVIMTIETSEAYAQADPTVVICPYDTLQMQNSVAPMAIGMYLAKNNEATGHLTVIFTDNTSNRFTGLQKLSPEYIPENANVFSLCSNSKSYWAVNTGGGVTYDFTGSLTYKEPTLNKAIKISIDGLPGGVPDPSVGSYPNPVKRLGNLLAQFKTNALIYELADFSGGVSGTLYPESASMTVLINEDDYEKLQKRVDKDIDKFLDKNEEDLENVTYTYEEVPLPEKVFDDESMNNFVSFIYTLLDGSYYKDDNEGEKEELSAFTSIGSIKINDEQFVISAMANSLKPDVLNEINNNYQLICGLSNIEFLTKDIAPTWSSPEDTEFVQEVKAAYESYSGKTFKLREYIPLTPATYVHALNNNCNIISLSVSGKGLDLYAGSILTFMMNQPHEEKLIQEINAPE